MTVSSKVVFVAIAALVSSSIIPNEFVVIFKDGVDSVGVASHMKTVLASGSEVLYEYNFGTFVGYSVRLPNMDKATKAFLAAPEIELAEPNMIVRTSAPVAGTES